MIEYEDFSVKIEPLRGDTYPVTVLRSPTLGLAGSILFTSDRDGKREVYSLTSQGLRRLTHSPGDSESWCPRRGAGDAVLFTSNRDGKEEVYHPSKGKTVRLTNSPR